MINRLYIIHYTSNLVIEKCCIDLWKCGNMALSQPDTNKNERYKYVVT
jgi:hypothetical protein